MLERSVGGDEYTAKVQINEMVHLFQRRLLERLGNGGTCVVDKNVELAKSLDGRFDRVLDGLGIGSVGPDRLRPSTSQFTSGRPPALRLAIDRCLKKSGVNLKPSHEVDNLGGIMSLIVSTGGVALLPAYAKNSLPSSVTFRPLHGSTPKIDLSVGYREANDSPVLKLFLSRINEHVEDATR